MAPQLPRPYNDTAFQRVQDERLTRLEDQLDDTSRELATQGERMKALHSTVEGGFDEVMDGIKTIASAVNDPEKGLVVRLGKLEADHAARHARRGWVLKTAIGALVSLAGAGIAAYLGWSN